MNRPLAVVMVRLWFDGANTYHSLRVVTKGNDKCVGLSYGYGDAYKNTLKNVIDVIKYNVVYDIVDVYRKKDLYQ